jgi:hypothetical protein
VAVRNLAAFVAILVTLFTAGESGAADPKLENGGASGKTKQHKGGSMSTDPNLEIRDIDRAPDVEIAAAAHYYIGLPIIVSVTLINRSSITEFMRTTPLNLPFYGGGNVSVSLVPTDARGILVEARLPQPEDSDPVVMLHHNKKRRMVWDLSCLGVAFKPGRYALTLTIRIGSFMRKSNTVPIELVELREADAREATRLRKLGDATADTGEWGPFLRNNWNTVTPSPDFSPEARAQLALHLFLHRATWIPGGVASLDSTPLDAIHAPQLAGEVAVLKYEIQHARHDRHAAGSRAALLARFPGLRYRVDEIEHGKGTLTAYRDTYGVEATFMRPPEHWPYQP